MHFTGTHLIGMHLMGTYFMGIHLISMYLAGAHLTGSNLIGVYLTDVRPVDDSEVRGGFSTMRLAGLSYFVY
jgi:uncharacterized protein YjbI with pentapeptide repeats